MHCNTYVHFQLVLLLDLVGYRRYRSISWSRHHDARVTHKPEVEEVKFVYFLPLYVYAGCLRNKSMSTVSRCTCTWMSTCRVAICTADTRNVCRNHWSLWLKRHSVTSSMVGPPLAVGLAVYLADWDLALMKILLMAEGERSLGARMAGLSTKVTLGGGGGGALPPNV